MSPAPPPPARRTWLVTGASSGVGHELCRQLLSRGHNVVAAARRVADFTHERALCLSCDVTDPAQLQAAAAQGTARFGSVDVLSCNAGQSSYLLFEDETDEHLRAIFEVNYFGTVHALQALLPRFRAQGHGLILINTSQSGLAPRLYGTAYCSTKFALEGLAGVVRLEAQRFCQVMCVELGFFPGTEVNARAQTADRAVISAGAAMRHAVYQRLSNGYPPVPNLRNDLPAACACIIDEACREQPQRRLLLGIDCTTRVTAELLALGHDLHASQGRALGVGRPAAPPPRRG